MVEFSYNNAKNTSIGYIHFELNGGFQPRVSYKKDIDPGSKLKLADQLCIKLQTIMSMYRENLQHA